MPRFRKVASYKQTSDLVAHALASGAELPVTASAPASAMATGWRFEDASAGGFEIGNRFTILPMEGWDATADGAPSPDLERRWLRFGRSGAKLLWFEATAVSHEGRANPRQLVLDARTAPDIARLREAAVAAHVEAHGSSEGLVTGLQLTHSGRWCRPQAALSPRIAYRHPLLDARAGVVDDTAVLSDAELEALIERFVDAAELVRDAGFDFVDLKHCHGYLAHELLSARERVGPFGGSLENRTRFLASTVEQVRERCPELAIAVRFSAFDAVPHRAGSDGVGEPETQGEYPFAFGTDGRTGEPDWDEIAAFVARLRALGIGLVCVTAGSPYYSPHIQRPAFFPPSDGYQPPRDPLVDTARLLAASREVKTRFPDLGVVGTGLTYLQQHLAEIAARCVAGGWMDSAGLGRMALSYPELPADVLADRKLARKLICRTFSDCTTAPRNGLVSGCYPLDEHYRKSDAYDRLQSVKRSD